MRHTGLLVRTKTTVNQHLPDNHEEEIIARFVKDKAFTVCIKDLGNIDEVPVSFDKP